MTFFDTRGATDAAFPPLKLQVCPPYLCSSFYSSFVLPLFFLCTSLLYLKDNASLSYHQRSSRAGIFLTLQALPFYFYFPFFLLSTPFLLSCPSFYSSFLAFSSSFTSSYLRAITQPYFSIQNLFFCFYILSYFLQLSLLFCFFKYANFFPLFSLFTQNHYIYFDLHTQFSFIIPAW